jgi:hypothetical protein
VRDTIADIDETTSDEPSHPGTALIVEAGDTLSRVIAPHLALGKRLTLLCVGRPVEIAGEVLPSRVTIDECTMSLAN